MHSTRARSPVWPAPPLNPGARTGEQGSTGKRHEGRGMQPSSDDKEYLASRAEYLASRAEYLSGDSSAGHAVGGLLMLQPSAPPPHHPMPPQPLHPLMHPAVPVPHGPLPHQLPQAAAYPAPMRVMVAPPHRLPQMGAASTHMHPHMVPHPCAAPPATWPSKRPVEMIQVRRAASHAQTLSARL